MPEVAVRAGIGRSLVVAFALISEMFVPKRFSGTLGPGCRSAQQTERADAIRGPKRGSISSRLTNAWMSGPGSVYRRRIRRRGAQQRDYLGAGDPLPPRHGALGLDEPAPDPVPANGPPVPQRKLQALGTDRAQGA